VKKEGSILDRAWELNEEYEKTAKITALGILAVGALGFVIYMIVDQVIPWILSSLGY